MGGKVLKVSEEDIHVDLGVIIIIDALRDD